MLALTIRYAAFAALAMAVNLGAQWLGLRVYDGPYALELAMVVGTGAGLVFKYILDKTWIFADRSTGLANHGRKFFLYTLMGLVTTGLFWGTELLFDSISPGGQMKFVGAALGLIIGYAIKFHLDRRFVFASAS
jgi:putative flippase GtrA